MSIGPYLDGNGMYYVSWTNAAGQTWECWFHTETIADMQAEHP